MSRFYGRARLGSSLTKSGRFAVVKSNRRLPRSFSKKISLDFLSSLYYTNRRSKIYGGNYGEFEDRRYWHPEGSSAPASSFDSPRHRLFVPRQNYIGRVQGSRPSRAQKFFYPSARIAFRNPSRVLVCVRRGIRREVMHATGFAGKVGQKRPRRGPYSSIRC